MQHNPLSKQFTDSFLNDFEKSELQRLVENKVLLGALKKILLSGVYYNGTLEAGVTPNATRNFALSFVATKEETNETLGARLRASSEGVQLVELGFQMLDQYGYVEPQEEKKVNKAK